MAEQQGYSELETQLALGVLDLALLKVLEQAGTDGLPLKLLAIKVTELLFRNSSDAEKRRHSVLIGIYRRLTSWEKKQLGLVYYRDKPVNRDFRIPNKMSRNPVGCYVLETEGKRQLERLRQIFSELQQSVSQ